MAKRPKGWKPAPRLADGSRRARLGVSLPSTVKEALRAVAKSELTSMSYIEEQVTIALLRKYEIPGYEAPEYIKEKPKKAE